MDCTRHLGESRLLLKREWECEYCEIESLLARVEELENAMFCMLGDVMQLNDMGRVHQQHLEIVLRKSKNENYRIDKNTFL